MTNIQETLLGDHPFTLTDELRWILGQPCFMLSRIFDTLRKNGFDIKKEAEDEQAVSLFWMLGHYAKHGPDGWRKAAIVELREMDEANKKAEKAKTARILETAAH